MKSKVLLSAGAVLLVLSFGFQGVRGIWQPDEGYYIGTAVNMDLHRDYLIPRLGEEIFLDKPPLLYWGILAGLKLFGYSEFSARFFLGLCYALTCLTVFELGRSFTGRLRDGFSAAVVYATMILPFSAANFLTMDTPLTLFTTLSMAAFWKSTRPEEARKTLWKILLCAAVGLGFLTKGPAALIPCGAMFVYLLVRREVISYLRGWWLPAGLFLFVLIGFIWYCFVSLRIPGAAKYLFVSQVWGRLVSDVYQRNPGLKGALIYLPVLLLGTLPWSIDWFRHPDGIRRFFRWEGWKRLAANPSSLFLACWICIPMAVLTFASSKLGLYALPVFPALALASARLLPSWFEESGVFSPEGRKGLTFAVIWSILLLGVRAGMGFVPVRDDCRALWKELKPYLPNGRHEIVAVGKRVDGLWFYGAMEVENISRDDTPYPSFTPPETVEKEVQDMLEDGFPHLFVLPSSGHLPILKTALEKSGWRMDDLPLRYGRRLLICRPPENRL
ncbi:MAG TPA: glycosyltransferase family 39 protein [Anaerohalosphaeraceae bacterium]|nr:glycosyltransferase family 39 protein [Anaerohalosphaeraceae bacterium]HOL89597.1 glycosyltransferase family 39 protein [Anaerohalosphaeraceae bacterium]HPP55087.1 glycosyltransferase family 39 protein [Anaerohalosphaeraceae bacterium]